MKKFAFALALALLVLPACDNDRKATAPPPKPGSSSTSSSSGPAAPNWSELKRRIPNVEAREQEALDKMKAAYELFKTWKADRSNKALLKQVKDAEKAAWAVQEKLAEDASEIHDDLWDNAFRAFDRTWAGYRSDKLFKRIQSQ